MGNSSWKMVTFSKMLLLLLDDAIARLFSIPPRSPDFNPNENAFNFVQSKLHREKLDRNISQETFHQFSTSVKETIMIYPLETVDKIIESMDSRISKVIKSKGQ